MSRFESDITVIGGGIAGLWTAKELVDEGLRVNVIERSESLASGATTRNEGWLHAGTYHAVAVRDEADARSVTERTVYGHNAIVDFAPESIEHEKSFALFADESLAHTAEQRWTEFGVAFSEVNPADVQAEGLALDRIKAAFAVRDKSVNSRVIVSKLARYIMANGGNIFTNAIPSPADSMICNVDMFGERHRFMADAFLVAAGTGTKGIFEELTGEPFPMRYFKSHLLVTERLSTDNIFYMDPLEAGLMSHGKATIVGINKEATKVDFPSYQPIPEKSALIHEALSRMLPRSGRLALENSMDVACIKADVADEAFLRQCMERSTVMQDLNIKVFEPAEGWICAIPGKMTEAPALARAASEWITKGSFGSSRTDTLAARIPTQTPIVSVKSRPTDDWLFENNM